MSTIDTVIMQHFGFDVKDDKDVFECPVFNEYKIKDEERREMFLTKNNEGSCGICPVCGSDNTFPVEKQKRSADEPKDFSIHCGNCRSSWQAK